MYQIDRDILRSGRRALALPQVSRTVLLLGLTSLFTDISSEMISTILPLYLVFGLGLSPLAFGFVDGLYQGAAALVRVASGLVSDRWRRHKEVATTGYALSAVCKLGYLAAGSALGALGGVVLLDRTGKGIRTAPRDALISLSTPPAELGTAFGVHRALDTAGAMAGPLVAFSLLALTAGAYDAVFVVSFFVALLGVGIISLFVENRDDNRARAAAASTVSLKGAIGLLRMPRFASLVLVGSVLGLATISDAFLYLGLQRSVQFGTAYLPLLYVGTALVYMLLAMPAGRLADRIGRGRVFLAGYALLLPVYATLLLPAAGLLPVGVALLLFGGYYAATDGVLMALASALLPPDLRGSGLALITTATNLTRLLASVLFGALWAWRGADAAVVAFGMGLVGALAFAALVLVRMRQSPSQSHATV